MNYTLNYFYGRGGAVWDAGWFAAMSIEPARWQVPNPPAIGGDFMALHMSPIFMALALVHRWFAASLSGPVFFALSQGFWHGIIGASLAWMLCSSLARTWTITALAVAGAGNGVALATLGFPHYEVAIPALLLATLALGLKRPRKAVHLWILPLILLLSIREDAGFQAAGIFGAIGILRLTREGRLVARPGLALALACALFSIVDLVFQRALFPAGGTNLSTVYLGSPPLAHLDLAFLQHRLSNLIRYRPYIWVPILLSASIAAITRDARLILGIVAILPWLAMAVVAVSELAGELTDYYGLPMMVAVVWPTVAACPAMGAAPQVRRRYLRLQAAMAALSVLLFGLYGIASHDPHPWRSFGFAWTTRARPMQVAVECLGSKLN